MGVKVLRLAERIPVYQFAMASWRWKTRCEWIRRHTFPEEHSFVHHAHKMRLYNFEDTKPIIHDWVRPLKLSSFWTTAVRLSISTAKRIVAEEVWTIVHFELEHVSVAQIDYTVSRPSWKSCDGALVLSNRHHSDRTERDFSLRLAVRRSSVQFGN